MRDPAERFELLLDAWDHRASLYEELGCEDEASQVRGCAQELRTALEANPDVPDRGETEFTRSNPAGILTVDVLVGGDHLHTEGTTGFTVARTDQCEYEVRL